VPPEGEHYVVLGNGAAGNAAADLLREHEPDARVTIISDERHLFYYRHLLPELALEGLAEEALWVRPYEEYRERRIRLRLGQRVTRLDTREKTLYLAHMEKVHYTGLILACGGRPSIPAPVWAFRDKLFTFKTLDDARRLRERAEGLRRVLMVGGDLVSLRVSRMLARRGVEVLFLIDGGSLWPVECTDEVRAEVAASLAQAGIQVAEGRALADVTGDEKGGFTAVTDDGGSHAADLVMAFFGFVPDVDFLTGSDLDVERGVLVDDYLRASREDVYAAGDCAQIYHPELGAYWVSIGWGNAGRQGGLAARNCLGDRARIEQAPEQALALEEVRVRTRWWVEMDGPEG